MSNRLLILNRQRTVPVSQSSLRRLTGILLRDLLDKGHFALGISVVDPREMTRLNETFLQHEGSTDVITFDYSSRPGKPREVLHGEIFICGAEAVAQARRFRTTWQSELARYVIHGVLHLCGYDDLRSRDRRLMKREENRLLLELSRRLTLRNLKRSPAPRTSVAPPRRKRVRRRFPLSKRSRNPRISA